MLHVLLRLSTPTVEIQNSHPIYGLIEEYDIINECLCIEHKLAYGNHLTSLRNCSGFTNTVDMSILT